MDLQEQRISCLRMAVEMGCKADSVFRTANELMGFVTSGAAPSAVTTPAVEAVGTPPPEPAPSPDEAAVAVTPDAEVASSAPPASAAAPVAAAKPVDAPAAVAKVGEPVSAAMVADAPAAGAESAAPEMSAGETAKPAVEAIAVGGRRQPPRPWPNRSSPSNRPLTRDRRNNSCRRRRANSRRVYGNTAPQSQRTAKAIPQAQHRRAADVISAHGGPEPQ